MTMKKQKHLDRRIVKTHHSIRQAFIQLMMKKDFTSITVAELARVANIDRKTFYLHYATTKEVLQEFEDELAGEVSALLHQNGPLSIADFLNGLNDIMIRNLPFYRKLSAANANTFFLVTCKNILKRSIVERFKPATHMSPADFDVYTEFIAAGTISIYTHWLNDQTGLSLPDLTASASPVIFNNLEQLTANHRNGEYER